jgi:HD-like signal output (HDOD) protein
MKRILLLSTDTAFTHKLKKRLSHTLNAFDSFEECSTLLKSEPFNLAIVDTHHEDSDALLDFLKTHYAHIVRVTIIEAAFTSDLTQVKQHKYSQLSWQKNQGVQELVGMIDKLIEIEARINNADLLNLVSSLKRLPTLPKIYFELTKHIEENTSIEIISLKLEEDPAVTTNILKLANSAFYNAKTGSIKQAIMYIGLNNVKNIILTNAVFGNDALDESFREIHWKHVSFANKLLNAMYIEVLGKKLNNNISAVGLLHDVGNIVLMCNFPTLLHEMILEEKNEKNRNLFLIEKNRIGFSHEELGGHLLDLWGLPFPMIEVALYHHDPLNPKIINRELVLAMHIADYYAWKYVGVNEEEATLFPEVFNALDIPKSIFDEFFENFIKTNLQ